MFRNRVIPENNNNNNLIKRYTDNMTGNQLKRVKVYRARNKESIKKINRGNRLLKPIRHRIREYKYTKFLEDALKRSFIEKEEKERGLMAMEDRPIIMEEE